MSRPSNFVSRSALGWGASGGSYANPKSGLVVHYDSTNMRLDTKPHSECVAYWKRTRSFHMGPQRGWADIGYSFFACPHDYILEGRGLNKQQAAQPGGNATHYSVTIAGGPSDPVTSGTINAVRRLRQWLVNSHGNSGRVLGHRDFLSTSCPGDIAYALVRNGTFGGAPGAPAPGGGSRSMADIQRAVNGLGYTPPLDVDGLDGPKTQAGVKWLQERVGASADGVWGPETERLYTAYMEDEVPIHSRYEKREPQTLERGEWVSLEFNERHDGREGGIYSVVGVESEEKPAGFYDISVGVVLEDVTPGAEVQIRATEYEADGSGGWQIARNRPLHSPVHVGGKAHFVYSWKSHKAKDRRVRFRIAQFGDGPATITSATSETFFWVK